MSRFQIHALVLIVLCGLTLAGTKAVAPSQQGKVSTEFSSIPMAFSGWSILEKRGFDEETQRLLPSSSLLLWIYEHPDYRIGTELAIVYGVDLGNFHQPEICLEGQGLRSQSKRLVRVRDQATGLSFDAMSLVMQSESGRLAFVYWFMSEGTTSTSLGNYKTQVMIKRLTLKDVKPSAMIRLSTVVTESDQASIKQLLDFADKVMPYLRKEFASGASSIQR